MKYFLIGTIFVCFVLIGVNIALFYKKKRDFYVNLCNFFDYAFSEISFSLKKTNEIVASFKGRCGDEFFDFLTFFEDFIDGKMTDEEFRGQKKVAVLSKEEWDAVEKAFLSFGKMNREEELGKIASYQKEFGRKKEECVEGCRKYRGLYLKLFVLLGLGAVVICL